VSFLKLFEIEYHLQAVFKSLDFLGEMWYKKGKKQGGKAMKERVFGCDVSKDYIILHDGSQAYKLSLENFQSIQKLVNNNIVVIEQTGAYGLRWGQVLYCRWQRL
jgi:hypothetical protein